MHRPEMMRRPAAKAWGRPVASSAWRVLRGLGLGCAAAWLVGCASTPAPPPWQSEAQGAAERFQRAHLEGATRAAEAEFRRAREAVAATADAARVAQVELLRCALEAASLGPAACPGFEPLRGDASPAQQVYADYLAGRTLSPQQVALLPPAQRPVATLGAATASASGALGATRAPGAPAASASGSTAGLAASDGAAADPAAVIARIEDPLSRLVAAGVAVRAGRASPRTLQVAVDTASAQGWRRPLLAWLQALALQAERAGDAAGAAQARARIRLVTGER